MADVTEVTQVKHPWTTTLRTVLQVAVALAAMLPVLVEASGVSDALPGIAGALAIAAGITRVMALPQVESFLMSYAPALAAGSRKDS